MRVFPFLARVLVVALFLLNLHVVGLRAPAISPRLAVTVAEVSDTLLLCVSDFTTSETCMRHRPLLPLGSVLSFAHVSFGTSVR